MIYSKNSLSVVYYSCILFMNFPLNIIPFRRALLGDKLLSLARRSCSIIVNNLLPTVEKIQVPKITVLNHLSGYQNNTVTEHIEGIIICKVFYRSINHPDSFTYNGNDKSFWIILSYSRWCISFLWPCINAINHKQRYLLLLIESVLQDAEFQAGTSLGLLLLPIKNMSYFK